MAPAPTTGLGDYDRSSHRDPHHDPYLKTQWIELAQRHIELIRERERERERGLRSCKEGGV
jgi:hypothetical protein